MENETKRNEGKGKEKTAAAYLLEAVKSRLRENLFSFDVCVQWS